MRPEFFRRSRISSSFLVFTYLLFLGEGQNEGDVQLVGGTYYQGTVEVFHNGQWGTICDDSWSIRDANVICRQLGYEGASRVWYRAHYGQGSGPIWVDQINCPSDNNVRSILNCSPPTPDKWGVHDCKKSEDAGVDCIRKFPVKPSSMPVRVSCPDCVQWGSCSACSEKKHAFPGDCSVKSAIQGIVFAQYRGEWLPVTADGWDINDSQVVCKELGYPIALPPPALAGLWTNWNGVLLNNCGRLNGLFSGPTYPPCKGEVDEGSSDGVSGDKPLDAGLCSEKERIDNDDFRLSLNRTLLTKVRCSGNEARLLDCYFPEFGPFPRDGQRVATVNCAFAPHESCPGDHGAQTHRLRGGPVPWEGRIEVKVNGKWGTICDYQWDITDANVACKALGYGAAETAYHRARHGRGVGPIHYSRVKCRGNEGSLAECEKVTGVAAENCGQSGPIRDGHLGDAGVRCVAPKMCPRSEENKIVRLIQLPNPEHPENAFIEMDGSYGQGLLCARHIQTQPIAANIICRSERELFVSHIGSGNAELYSRSVRYGAEFNCTGNETSVEKCQMTVMPLGNCDKYGGEAVVICSTDVPDLVPDLETLRRSLMNSPRSYTTPISQLTCAREENCLSSSANGQGPNSLRRLLRFDSLTMNWGTGDFRPNRPQRDWQYHSCHNHYHSFEAFIHYDLLSFTTGEKVAEGHKASFCLEDSVCSGGTRGFGCHTGQGISPNCGDLYGRFLDCQWIDITDVPNNLYLLRLIVNPDKLVVESDHGNNVLTCAIEIRSVQVLPFWCRLSDH